MDSGKACDSSTGTLLISVFGRDEGGQTGHGGDALDASSANRRPAPGGKVEELFVCVRMVVVTEDIVDRE